MRLIPPILLLFGFLLAPLGVAAYSTTDEEVPANIRAQGEEAVLAWVNLQNEQSHQIQLRVAQERFDAKQESKREFIASLKAEAEDRVRIIERRKEREVKDRKEAGRSQSLFLIALVAIGSLGAAMWYTRSRSGVPHAALAVRRRDHKPVSRPLPVRTAPQVVASALSINRSRPAVRVPTRHVTRLPALRTAEKPPAKPEPRPATKALETPLQRRAKRRARLHRTYHYDSFKDFVPRSE